MTLNIEVEEIFSLYEVDWEFLSNPSRKGIYYPAFRVRTMYEPILTQADSRGVWQNDKLGEPCKVTRLRYKPNSGSLLQPTIDLNWVKFEQEDRPTAIRVRSSLRLDRYV